MTTETQKTEIETMIDDAILTSIQENRCVSVELPSIDDLYTIDYEGHADENDGTHDVWGTTNEGSEWRLNVTVVTRYAIEYRDAGEMSRRFIAAKDLDTAIDDATSGVNPGCRVTIYEGSAGATEPDTDSEFLDDAEWTEVYDATVTED